MDIDQMGRWETESSTLSTAKASTYSVYIRVRNLMRLMLGVSFLVALNWLTGNFGNRYLKTLEGELETVLFIGPILLAWFLATVLNEFETDVFPKLESLESFHRDRESQSSESDA